MNPRKDKVVKMTGATARNFMASQILNMYGEEEALRNTCGPMKAAIEAEIKFRKEKQIRPLITREQSKNDNTPAL